MNKLELTSRE